MATATIVKQVEPGIAKLSDGCYRVDVRPQGRGGQRYRKKWPTLGEARRDKARAITRGGEGGQWKAPPKDTRSLADLAAEWHRIHGHTLADGAGRLSNMLFIIEKMGNPKAGNFSENDYLSFRVKRLADGISENTCNHDLAHLKSMFNRLRKAGLVNENPLTNTSKLHHAQSEVRFLELQEISQLLTVLDESKSPDCSIITKICLATGARWSESEQLRREQVTECRIEYANTKNGQARAIPISKKLEAEIVSNRPRYGRLFRDGYRAFELAIHRAGIVLPKGQRTHVLRHSFAVHFMRQRGNILDLQKILGHKTLHMTLRYAQFHPDYLADAVSKNPLASLEQF